MRPAQARISKSKPPCCPYCSRSTLMVSPCQRRETLLLRYQLGFPREPLEVIEHGRNQLLPPGIIGGQRIGKKIEKIARLLGSFAPVRGRCRDEMRFQFILPKAQRPL